MWMDAGVARVRMHLAAVWWSAGKVSDATAVRAAGDALAAGLDGPRLRELARVSPRHPGGEVRALIGPALADLGLPFRHRDGVPGGWPGSASWPGRSPRWSPGRHGWDLRGRRPSHRRAGYRRAR